MRKRERNVAIGTLIAAGLGYAVGVLTAPKSGRETRKQIRESALRAKREAERQLKDAHTELSKVIRQSKSAIKKMSESSQDELTTLLAKAEKAKEKARVLLSALHEGESEDKDLQKAIQDAEKAVQHLRTYLRKHA